MHRLTHPLARAATGALLALSITLLAAPAQAQNSREATEAVRKHRAETSSSQRSTPAPAPHKNTSKGVKPDTSRPFSSSADPTANPTLNLKSCMDHAGMTMAPTEPREAIVQLAGTAGRRGEFDEFEAVDRHRIGGRRGLHAKIGG